MSLEYSQQTINARNPIARFAHRSRLARSIAHATKILPTGGTLLDFGCGIGDFLIALRAVRQDADLVGFDPYQGKPSAAYNRIHDIRAAPSSAADVLCAFEVLEHLTDEEIETFLLEARRMLKPGGKLLISVPIIAGPTLLLKEANRYRMFRRLEYSVPELVAAAFLGKPAPRAVDRKTSHKGFDFRAALAMVQGSFALRSSDLCPFQNLPWWLNSQVFWIFAR